MPWQADVAAQKIEIRRKDFEALAVVKLKQAPSFDGSGSAPRKRGQALFETKVVVGAKAVRTRAHNRVCGGGSVSHQRGQTPLMEEESSWSKAVPCRSR